MTGFASLLAAAALLQAEPVPAPAPPAGPAPETAPAPSPIRPSAGAPAAAPAPGAPPPSAAPPATAPAASPPAASAPAEAPAPPPRVRIDPAQERADAERIAREFLDALVAGDATRLSAAAAERFSFDGASVSGRDAIRAAWSALLAGRPGPAPRVGAVELLPAAEALARLGKPPPRVAPLARPGAFVVIADVGGRAVVLFVAREAGRAAVLGMHD